MTMTAPQSKKQAALEARTVSGHVVTKSPISGDFEAVLSDSDTRAPLPGREVVFSSTAGHNEIGRATTDTHGIATMNSGTRLTQPALVAEVLASGYDARFPGDDQYAPAQDHASTAVQP
ncbi:hypothetical protein [Streptomyces palmae]|uniref:Uncharacterized protein n=1 Tax=Streptomyces palmae TaxID=1701085 RepID=A0A4Z0GP87_9ACTN|nr:hypothetical protein [Streptomyces palmae]TGA98775.1 hypothetical protein E4099_22800 [Streptomyces palmae]